jgi:predicted amino acid racemase
VDQLSQLLLYRELLELKFDHRLPLISAGSTELLPPMIDGKLPRRVNHFRIGEACFLGTDPVSGEVLPGFRDDVVRVETEIAEIKEKSLVPIGETGGITPFEHTAAEPDDDLPPGQRGYRALVTIGQLDTDVFGLTPVRSGHQIAGASSDISVVNLGEENGYRVGETIKFKPSYEAFVRLMASSYVHKAVQPSLDEFARTLPERWKTPVPPMIEAIDVNEILPPARNI